MCKNKYNHLLRTAKKKFFSDQFKNSASNIKGTWKIINQLLQKKKASSKCPPSFSNGKTSITNPFHIACKFNELFVNVGVSISKKIGNTNDSPTDYIRGCFPSVCYLELPDNKEINYIIMELKNSISGHDEICASLVKEVISSIIKPLTHIFAVSMETGIVPSDLKLAKVIPLFKSGDPGSFTNYCTISVLSCFSKILEKLVYKRILKHLNMYKILFKHQYGFRKNHSAYMALLRLVDKIHTALEKKEFACGIFLDLSKAFDAVDHDILPAKLYRYGFSGHVLKWLSNYVSNREQYVNINGIESKRAMIQCGVPQGSILGPLLFLIYINDLAAVSNTIFPVLFADDTNLLIANKI